MALSLTGTCQTISELKNRAEYRNDSWAQNALGLKYEKGEEVNKNLQTAFSWFQKSANNNYCYAQYNLARFYEKGLYVQKDIATAIQYYKKAASNYHSYSCFKMGKFYLNGTNVPKDNSLAFSYFKDAAFTGNSEGKYYYAYCYAYGYGTRKDSVRALLWIDRAIDDKYYYAYYLKGLMYQDGISVSQNDEKSYDAYFAGAYNNDAACQNSVAVCLWKGRGCRQNKEKAIDFFKQSAENGNLYGQRNLAYRYLQGEEVEQSFSKAAYWFEKAASHNDEKSYEELASIYLHMKQYDELFNACKKGASFNNIECINQLAYCYANGWGIKIDIKQAINIIDKAITEHPDNPNLYDSKGEFLLMKKSYKKAKEMWDKVKFLDEEYYNENSTPLNEYMIKQ